MSEVIVTVGAILIAMYVLRPPVSADNTAKMFFHVKHNPVAEISTKGEMKKIQNIINSITGETVGIEPEPLVPWAEQLEIFQELKNGNIPVMLKVFASDTMLTIDEIAQVIQICDVKYIRITEVISHFDEIAQPFPIEYVHNIFDIAKQNGIPVVWTEWNIYTFPKMAEYIIGYEDTVLACFETNSNQVEPIEGFQMLITQGFVRRAASVQSWYWQTRGKGTELEMPAYLMKEHLAQAWNAGSEIVQFEPFSYFFNNDKTAKNTLAETFS
jgi:hypothetical protein